MVSCNGYRFCHSPSRFSILIFMGGSLVFMLLYVWSREFPSANDFAHGVSELTGQSFDFFKVLDNFLLICETFAVKVEAQCPSY